MEGVVKKTVRWCWERKSVCVCVRDSERERERDGLAEDLLSKGNLLPHI